MKKLIVLSLVCCLVLAMTAPVSADYFLYKDVNADDFTNALVDYCNHNEVHNITTGDFKLNGHAFRSFNVTRTNTTLDFNFKCGEIYFIFIHPMPIPLPYSFSGVMHVDNPQSGLKKPYVLTITDEDTKFTAEGENWKLQVWNTDGTRFKMRAP